MIKIICIGKLKEKYLIDSVKDYLTRLRKYHKIDLIEQLEKDEMKEVNEMIKEGKQEDGERETVVTE